MLLYDAVLFDLDGTLTRSEEGITRSAIYAAEKLGFPGFTKEQVMPFIGPPLHHSFQQIMGMTSEQADEAVALYRERFSRIGWMENEVYEKFEKGDILGGIAAMGEGFVDTIIGGAIEVGGNVLGDYVDDKLLSFEDAKLLYTFNKTYQYQSGLKGENDDEGYSIGGIIQEGFRKTADDLDRLTDGDTSVMIHGVNSRWGYLAI